MCDGNLIISMILYSALPPASQTGLWPVQTGLWPVQTGLWPVQTGIWPVQTGLWPVQTGCWPVQTGLQSVQTGPHSTKQIEIKITEMCFTDSDDRFDTPLDYTQDNFYGN